MQGIDSSHPFIQKLQSNPHILQQLADFTILLQEKGLDTSNGKQPGFGQVSCFFGDGMQTQTKEYSINLTRPLQIMKFMSDPEVKEKAAKLAQDMQAAGIQMDMNTVMELQKAFGGPRSAEGEEQENSGLLNKAKGFFKK
jgi:hypothetical protein